MHKQISPTSHSFGTEKELTDWANENGLTLCDYAGANGISWTSNNDTRNWQAYRMTSGDWLLECKTRR